MVQATTTSKKVICIGRIMIDIIITGLDFAPSIGEQADAKSYVITPGGGPSYVAIGLSKLGIGSGILALVGNDFFGEYLKKTYECHGIDTTGIEMNSEIETTISVEMSFVSESDRATIVTGKVTDPDLQSEKVNSLLKSANHVHLIGISPERVELLKVATSNGLTTSLDTDLRRGDQRELLMSAFPYLDYFMPNLNELKGYSESSKWENILMEIGSSVRKYCIVKMGNKGAAGSNGKTIIQSPAFPIQVIDTTGSGDMFNAGFISGILNNVAAEEAMLLGNAMGGLKAAQAGIASFPDLDQLKTFLAQNNQKISF